MDKLNLKFLTVRILELDLACYGGCPLLDTSNVYLSYTTSAPFAYCLNLLHMPRIRVSNWADRLYLPIVAIMTGLN